MLVGVKVQQADGQPFSICAPETVEIPVEALSTSKCPCFPSYGLIFTVKTHGPA